MSEIQITSKLLQKSSKLYNLIDSTLQRFIKLTGAQRGFLILVNEKGEFEIKISRNFENKEELLESVNFSKSILNKLITEKTPILTHNASDDSSIDLSNSILSMNLKSIICVPLIVKDNLIGAIYMENNEISGQFTSKHLHSLEDFAYRASISIKAKLATFSA